MKRPVLNDLRWGELTGWLTGISGILVSLQSAPLPENVKPWLTVGVSAIAFVGAFLRNPKTLPWQEGIQLGQDIQAARDFRTTGREDEV